MLTLRGRLSTLLALGALALAPCSAWSDEGVLMETRRDAQGRVHATFRNAMGEVVATSFTERAPNGGIRAVVVDMNGSTVATVESRASARGGTESLLKDASGSVLRRWSDPGGSLTEPRGFGRKHYNPFARISPREVSRHVEETMSLDARADHPLRPRAPDRLVHANPPQRERLSPFGPVNTKRKDVRLGGDPFADQRERPSGALRDSRSGYGRLAVDRDAGELRRGANNRVGFGREPSSMRGSLPYGLRDLREDPDDPRNRYGVRRSLPSTDAEGR